MKYYELNKKWYNKEELSLHQILDITPYMEDMVSLIDYFNSEYAWDEMFNIDDCIRRIENGNQLFILKLNNKPIGYVWFKEIDTNTCFGYNLYVTKQIERPKYAPNWFYNKVSGIMLQKYNTIKVEIEDWNTTVFDLVKNIGYKEII
jgi:hypothetical protein